MSADTFRRRFLTDYYNRFHNYVVEQLAVINEGGRFKKPTDSMSPEMQEQAWAKYDNDLFQVGRL